MRQLAALAGTDPGYVSRLLDLFHREELIEREPRGPVSRRARWRGSSGAGRRTTGSATRTGSCRSRTRTACRARWRALRDASVPHALTARAGAAALSGTALPGIVAAYVDNPERVAAELGAEPTDSGANLLLIDPFDPLRVRRDVGGVRPALRRARADHRRPARQPRARARAGGELARGDGGARARRATVSAASA